MKTNKTIRETILILLILTFVLTTDFNVQAQTNPIDPSRRIDWSNAGVQGGIPNRTFTCATFNPGATAAQINSAIASCASNVSALAAGGGVVFLNAGTYNLSSGINFKGASNVTVRGAGANQTKLVISGTAPCIGAPDGAVSICGSSNLYPEIATPVNWTAGFAKGTTQITLSSTAGLSIGQMLALDQCNDDRTGASCGTVSTVDKWPDVYMCAELGTCTIEGPGTGDSRLNIRLQQQIVKIAAINGNQVTITPGLYMPNWRLSQSPQAWTWGTIAETSMRNGIEDMTLDYRNAGGLAGISVVNAYESWIKGVRGIGPAGRSHVWMDEASHTEIRGSYFYGSGGSSTSYGIETFQSSDALIINNILHHVVTPLNQGMGAGNVWAYNFVFDTSRSDFPTAMGSTVITHQGGIGMNLYEGNQGPGFRADSFHGNSHFGTLFRNQFTGSDTVNFPSLTGCTQAVLLDAFHRFYNIIGNVLGQAGYHTDYEVAYPAQPSDTAIYDLGHNNACGNSSNLDDSNLKQSLFRWGNYDVITDTDRFVASEVPTGLTKYANAVPASQALPVSFFLPSSQPSWWTTPWGTPAWPAVGPDVTGGNVFGYGGRVWKNPARLCFENTPNDGANPYKLFSASVCYVFSAPPPDTTPPTSPTGLTVQ